MIIRTAYWCGALAASSEAAFFEGVVNLLPMMRQLPGVRDVFLKRPYEHENGPCYHFAELSVIFDSKDDLQLMLSSPGRANMRAAFAKLAPLYDGSIHHINFEAI